jgi:hypothetical protein
VRIRYRGWEDFVRQTRTFALTQGLDPLAPFDVFLDERDAERLRNESYGASLRWDTWDHFFVYGSGMLAALTDFLLVRIPKTMASGQYAGQEGSPLTDWFKQYDTRPGQSEGRFADWARKLEETCKTPYDRQAAVLDGGTGRHTRHGGEEPPDPVAGSRPRPRPVWRTGAAPPDQTYPNTGGKTITTIAAHTA